ncbi:MAG TPA: hypothetical protein DFL85_00265 [Lentisphaeria bacterium]|mgnify:FL=1|jgi:transcriptional regulator, gntR family|uniref:winged helix-turn-helix domain-containing protein n=1 Tax=uncultured Victivallis sp. TaxID=354118 RepID=UPI000E7D4966|nr:winged helix-turn-helix transcriptional regulator [Lentisphaeria bacterium]HBP06173.1 hypothetical protein [Lentisphaeria bacterium]HCH83928.1 hypothetical protein [Lentisphaeria bacterium]
MEQKIPVFKETAGTLSAQIRERNFAPGTAQPSENELCRRYSISCFPVRKALSLLEADDLIVRQPGIRSIVREYSGGHPRCIRRSPASAAPRPSAANCISRSGTRQR